MSIIWKSLIDLQNHFIEEFSGSGIEVQEPGMEQFNKPGWVNRVWTSNDYRRAHVDVVDMREEKKMWMMHVCVFPHTDSDAPIYGFDVIAGTKLMTGAFHDFSATTNIEHPMIDWFGEVASALSWKRERQLPPWAKAIFTDHMIAASAVKDPIEIAQLTGAATETLSYYLKEVGNYNGISSHELGIATQNNYAHYQKQNPHTPRVMKSLGIDPDDVDLFIQKCLFPEL